jgi:hypothetical protein
MMLFMILCCFLMLVLGSGLWWLPLSLLGVSLALLVPVVGLLVVFSPLIAVVLVARGLLSRLSATTTKRTVAPQPAAAPVTEARPSLTRKDLLIADGEAKVDLMRTHARRISKPAVRAQALEICALADRVLAILPEAGDEQTARDVIERYLGPAEAIISRYARLITRDVSSAAATLRQVETDDLPLIERQLHALYDRLNRGDLIDLEVAREMLQFDFPTAPLAGSRGESVGPSPSQ